MQKQAEHAAGRSASTSAARHLAPGDEREGAAFRARGAGVNPASRFETISLAQLPEGGGDDDLIHEEFDAAGERRIPTRYFRDSTRTIINPVDSPDLHFAWTINPYRGCEHGCIYCYARPTHEYLGLSSGIDFETQIFAKMDAAELLKKELAHPRWRGEGIMMSGITDCYQPIERRLKITRACLEVMAECNQPVSIVTKSALVLRDLDLLSRLASNKATKVAISLTTLDPHLSAIMEPRASSPQQRLRAIRELTDAGVPAVAMLAPVIPAITDREMPALLQAAKRAGAVGAGYVYLRLPWQNKQLFLDWLARHFPERAKHVESLVRGGRNGKLYESEWGKRMRGEGPHAEQIGQTFRIFVKKYGLDQDRTPLSSAAFIRPVVETDPGQLKLFG